MTHAYMHKQNMYCGRLSITDDTEQSKQSAKFLENFPHSEQEHGDVSYNLGAAWIRWISNAVHFGQLVGEKKSMQQNHFGRCQILIATRHSASGLTACRQICRRHLYGQMGKCKTIGANINVLIVWNDQLWKFFSDNEEMLAKIAATNVVILCEIKYTLADMSRYVLGFIICIITDLK